MSAKSPVLSRTLKKCLLCIVALLIILGMVRLGVWQLDRANEKQLIADRLESRAKEEAITFNELNIGDLTEKTILDQLRFRPISLSGRYIDRPPLFVDNQVVNGRVGYQVFSAFRLENSDLSVLISRGWVSVGQSRQVLPKIITVLESQTLTGKLNHAPAKPPLWDDQYEVSSDDVWQYLPISTLEGVLQSKVFPLVVELAPEEANPNRLVRKWPEIGDYGVAKHKAYALQWFAMAIAFFIACLVVLLRNVRTDKVKNDG